MSPRLAGGLVVGALVAAVAAGIVSNSRPDLRCMKRPAGVAVEKCSRVCAVDPMGRPQPPPCNSGDEIVMQPGKWVDNGGCVEVACSAVFK